MSNIYDSFKIPSSILTISKLENSITRQLSWVSNLQKFDVSWYEQNKIILNAINTNFFNNGAFAQIDRMVAINSMTKSLSTLASSFNNMQLNNNTILDRQIQMISQIARINTFPVNHFKIDNSYVEELINSIDTDIEITREEISDIVSDVASVKVEDNKNWQQRIKEKFTIFENKNPVYASIIIIIITQLIWLSARYAFTETYKIIQTEISRQEYFSKQSRIKSVNEAMESNYTDLLKIANSYMLKNNFALVYNSNSFRSRTIGKLNAGDIVLVQEKYKSWLKVEIYDDNTIITGWVQSKYFHKIK